MVSIIIIAENVTTSPLQLALPLAIKLINFRINVYVRLGYGIGKGFVVGEEDVLQQFERISAVVHKNIAYKMRKKVDVSRLDVIRSLGMCKLHAMAWEGDSEEYVPHGVEVLCNFPKA